MSRYRITIDRWSGTDEISREGWKDLISALVLVGFEVYGDDGKIVFETSDGEIVEEIEE